MGNKISIRFYKDHKVRAIWDEKQNQWWFSVLDIVGAINKQDDHEKNRNYWKYLKAKLKKEQNEVVSDTTQLKMKANGVQLVSVTNNIKFRDLVFVPINWHIFFCHFTKSSYLCI